MSTPHEDDVGDEMEIRFVRPDDYPAVGELFRDGLEEGHVRANDTGADIENIQEAYFSDEGDSGFWVADLDSRIVGMIGVQKTEDSKAEIRRLRVRTNYRRRGVGRRLLKHALNFCQQRSHLRVILDVEVDRGPAIALFESSGFKLHRVHEVNGRKMLDFMLDLYTGRETS